MRLIDGDALADDLYAMYVHTSPMYKELITKIKKMVDKAPTVKLHLHIEKHARWTHDGFCTACGNEAEYTEWVEDLVGYDWNFNMRKYGEEVHRNHKLTNFCSNCGSKMDGEENEQG